MNRTLTILAFIAAYVPAVVLALIVVEGFFHG